MLSAQLVVFLDDILAHLTKHLLAHDTVRCEFLLDLLVGNGLGKVVAVPVDEWHGRGPHLYLGEPNLEHLLFHCSTFVIVEVEVGSGRIVCLDFFGVDVGLEDLVDQGEVE